MRAVLNLIRASHPGNCSVLSGFALAVVAFLPQPAGGQNAASLASASVDHTVTQSVERMDMIVKSSRVLSLADRIPRFQVHNEEVLGATPISESQIQIFAKNPGTTQINLWDTQDKLYTIDVTVVADAREVEGILSSQLPLASLRVTPVRESAILSGHVTSVDDVERAVAIAEQFYTVVINNIEVVGVQQVLLHTKIMEVSRTKLRRLGVDLAIYNSDFTLLNGPSEILNVPLGLTEQNAFNPAPFAGKSNLRFNVSGDFESLIDALHRNELVKLLAEPTVVATHGRPARFTVGGRVPYIVPGANGQVQVNYQDYGTSIDFLPFVVGPGRIRLEVRPEVSEVDPTRSIVSNGANVTAFTTRYVETAVEMQAGQTFALAGLLQSRTDAKTARTPLLGAVPYLGALFRNVQEERNEIELLIMVTPELAEAMDPHQVPRGGPGLNTDSPDDCELYVHGHIEVPNLKSDQCYLEGQHCGPDGLMGEPIYGMPPAGPTIVPPGGYESVPAPVYEQPLPPSAASPVDTDARQASTTRARRQDDVRQTKRWTKPATRNRSESIPQVASRGGTNQTFGRYESGKLLPANRVVPTKDPRIIGEGVSVSSPVRR